MYSLHKCRKILHAASKRYRKKKKVTDKGRHFEEKLKALKEAIGGKERKKAEELCREIEKDMALFLPRTPLEKTFQFILGLSFALAIAILIRQTWFEPYVIPTGSMRPTLKEQDFVFVFKTDFGLNVPLSTSQFYFGSDLIKRGQIVVFTGEDMDIPDVNTMYFYLIPGKKQFVKRLIAKPGDLLYFYGGLLYGIDRDGNEITEYKERSWFHEMEHIPFIHFDGKVKTGQMATHGIFTSATLYQMNEPIAKLTASVFGEGSGEMLPIPRAGSASVVPNTYGDLWGFKNYGMGKIVSGKEITSQEKAPLFLEITHHPSMHPVKIIRDEYGRVRPGLSYTTSILPLSDKAIDRLFLSLYTARFVVKNGRASLYGSRDVAEEFLPKLEGVPDGTYEFQDGKAYKVLWSSITKELAKNHPLYLRTPERLQLFYNLGNEFHLHIARPSRYIYFRDHDLYAMGHPIYQENDPELQSFIQKEKATDTPFIDLGSPIKDGKLQVELLKKNGLYVPENMYLVLGDNHARSSDSRVFGFVPQGNIRGGVNLLFWPLSPRMGSLPEPGYSWITLPNIVVWIVAIICFFLSFSYYKRKTKT